VDISYKSQIPGWSENEDDGYPSKSPGNLSKSPSSALSAALMFSKSPGSSSVSFNLSKSPGSASMSRPPTGILKSPANASSGGSGGGGGSSSNNGTKQLSKKEKKLAKQSRRAADRQSISQQGPNSAPSSSTITSSANSTAATADKQPLKMAKQISLFSHLSSTSNLFNVRKELRLKSHDLHPSIIRLSCLFQQYKILGSNARCLAMIQAFRDVVRDYKVPPQTILCRHLDLYLKPQISYIVNARGLSIGMGNFIRYLKISISQVGNILFSKVLMV
jgi:hypothetical protein